MIMGWSCREVELRERVRGGEEEGERRESVIGSGGEEARRWARRGEGEGERRRGDG